MKMRKIMSIAAAAVLAAVCMTSCGSSSDDSAAKDSGAEPAQAQQAAPEEQSASASDVAKKLFDGITYTDSLRRCGRSCCHDDNGGLQGSHTGTDNRC